MADVKTEPEDTYSLAGIPTIINRTEAANLDMAIRLAEHMVMRFATRRTGALSSELGTKYRVRQVRGFDWQITIVQWGQELLSQGRRSTCCSDCQ